MGSYSVPLSGPSGVADLSEFSRHDRANDGSWYPEPPVPDLAPLAGNPPEQGSQFPLFSFGSAGRESGMTTSTNCEYGLEGVPGRSLALGPYAGYQDRGDRRSQEPRTALPLFSGNSEWKVFWLQFGRLAKRFGWSEDATLDRLISCLRDEALEHFVAQSTSVQCSLRLAVMSFQRRFDDQRLPETYRAELQTIRKQSKESLEEYSSRVRRLVSKAYPDMVGTYLCEDITIEHMVGGLPDQTLIYDVLTKKPKSVEEALDLIRWHESCKGIQKRRVGVRQIVPEDTSAAGDLLINRVGGKSYVTEERLNQCIEELAKSLRGSSRGQRRNADGNNGGRDGWKRKVECYSCQEIGHIARECPHRGDRKVPEEAVASPIEPLN